MITQLEQESVFDFCSVALNPLYFKNIINISDLYSCCCSAAIQKPRALTNFIFSIRFYAVLYTFNQD